MGVIRYNRLKVLTISRTATCRTSSDRDSFATRGQKADMYRGIQCCEKKLCRCSKLFQGLSGESSAYFVLLHRCSFPSLFSDASSFSFQVSWLKRHGDTPHLLTFGLTTYSSDSRFQIFHEPPNDWKLQIQFPQLSDQGIYECMVSSNPPLLRRTRLTVIGEQFRLYSNILEHHRAACLWCAI